jgi:hypothetical protein
MREKRLLDMGVSVADFPMHTNNDKGIDYAGNVGYFLYNFIRYRVPNGASSL